MIRKIEFKNYNEVKELYKKECIDTGNYNSYNWAIICRTPEEVEVGLKVCANLIKDFPEELNHVDSIKKFEDGILLDRCLRDLDSRMKYVRSRFIKINPRFGQLYGNIQLQIECKPFLDWIDKENMGNLPEISLESTLSKLEDFLKLKIEEEYVEVQEKVNTPVVGYTEIFSKL